MLPADHGRCVARVLPDLPLGVPTIPAGLAAVCAAGGTR
jgi:hypothetical protein